MYAMADREEDLKIGVKSTAILFAKYDRVIIGVLQILLLLILVKIAIIFKLGMFYNLSLLIVAVLMVYHQKLIKNREKTACFKAFLHNNYIGLVVFTGIALKLSFFQ
ncbi:4-hydroxybenzoate polyprenyltransferase [hydrothermal vent metagenome]